MRSPIVLGGGGEGQEVGMKRKELDPGLRPGQLQKQQEGAGFPRPAV